MALFKIFGNFASGNTTLPTSATQGFCYFDKNTGKFYIDTSTTATPALNVDRLALNANKADDLNIVGTIDVSTGNKNLNNYTTPGRYYIPYLFYKTGGTGINPTGYSLSNCPVSISPLLESQSNTRTQAELQIFANNSIIIQIFTGFDALTKVIERYIRIYHNAWGIWLRMTLPTTETEGKFLTYDTNTNKYSFVTVDASNVTYDQTSINNNETVEFLSDGNIELTTTEEAINFLLDEMTYSILDINNILDNALFFDETADGYPQHYLTGDPEDDYQVATKHYVDQAFASNDAMIFKGTLAGAATTTYTPAAERGHTYKVSTAGLINGEKVEVGDMLICITDATVAATSSNVNTIKNNWAIIQTNIDGAVTGPSSATDNAVALFNGTTGKIIKNSAKTITTATPAAASTSATIPTSNAVWSAISGASGYGKTGTVTSVQVQATAPVVSSSSASASTSLSTTISLANGYGDTKNPYAAKTANYVLVGPSSGNAAVPTFRKLVMADLPATYYANIQTTSAATYNTAPEMATLKLNGNTSATAASTSNVTLVYDSTNQALNFVFA